ncbi:hypothetical protein [Halalkalibacter oceani]|uniref:hypothetical protein n=1 Tax=Halalkalibacter oceani TaxID=1653776 RepID=UPI0033932B8A
MRNIMDMIVDGLSVLEDKNLTLIDFNKELSEVYVFTDQGNFTITFNEGIPQDVINMIESFYMSF